MATAASRRTGRLRFGDVGHDDDEPFASLRMTDEIEDARASSHTVQRRNLVNNLTHTSGHEFSEGKINLDTERFASLTLSVDDDDDDDDHDDSASRALDLIGEGEPGDIFHTKNSSSSRSKSDSFFFVRNEEGQFNDDIVSVGLKRNEFADEGNGNVDLSSDVEEMKGSEAAAGKEEKETSPRRVSDFISGTDDSLKAPVDEDPIAQPIVNTEENASVELSLESPPALPSGFTDEASNIFSVRPDEDEEKMEEKEPEGDFPVAHIEEEEPAHQDIHSVDTKTRYPEEKQPSLPMSVAADQSIFSEDSTFISTPGTPRTNGERSGFVSPLRINREKDDFISPLNTPQTLGGKDDVPVLLRTPQGKRERDKFLPSLDTPQNQRERGSRNYIPSLNSPRPPRSRERMPPDEYVSPPTSPSVTSHSSSHHRIRRNENQFSRISSISEKPAASRAADSPRSEYLASLPDHGTDVLGKISPHVTVAEAERLNRLGAELLARGRNKEALDAYRRALDAAKQEMEKVKVAMQAYSATSDRDDDRSVRSSISIRSMKITPRWKRLDSSRLAIAATMADILNNMGVAYEMMEKFDSAVRACRKALEVYVGTCGRSVNSGDIDVDRTARNIEQMEMAQKAADKRDELHRYAAKLEKRIEKFQRSSEHVDSSALRAVRGDVMNTLRTALVLERDALGSEHPSVAMTLLDIGRVHCMMNNLPSAMREINRAVIILRGSLGPKHPTTGRALTTLANLYDERNKKEHDRDKALALYGEALRALRASLGEVNSEVGAVLNNIAVIYHSRAQYRWAMRTFWEALEAYGEDVSRGEGQDGFKSRKGTHREDDLDELLLEFEDRKVAAAPMTLAQVRAEHKRQQFHHPDVAHVWNNIGEIHARREEWSKALDAYQAAMDLLARSMRSNAVNAGRSSNRSFVPIFETQDEATVVAATMQSVGFVQYKLKWHGKAMKSYEEALRIQRTAEVTSNPGGRSQASPTSLAHILEMMGILQEEIGNNVKSMEIFQKALAMRRSDGNGNGLDVAELLGRIGALHLKTRHYDEAVTVLRESIRLWEKNGVMQDDAKLMEIKNKLSEAELVSRPSSRRAGSNFMGDKASAIPRRYQGREDGAELAYSWDQQAESLRKRGDYDGAMRACKQALKLRREIDKKNSLHTLGLGSNHSIRNDDRVDIARTMRNMAYIHSKRREYDEARVMYEEALRIYINNGLSDSHPYVRTVKRELKSVKSKRQY